MLFRSVAAPCRRRWIRVEARAPDSPAQQIAAARVPRVTPRAATAGAACRAVLMRYSVQRMRYRARTTPATRGPRHRPSAPPSTRPRLFARPLHPICDRTAPRFAPMNVVTRSCSGTRRPADDADALHRTLTDAGMPIVAPPADGPFGRFFTFRDLDGYAITVHTAGRPSA